MDTLNLITQNDPTSFITESYKLLRTNLNFKNEDNRYQVILVTSSGKEEGKSTTIANLAVTFAQEDKRVLLIDADLRLPRINIIFNINERKNGLSNMLVDNIPFKSLVNKIENFENLEILTAGNKNISPTELLNSKLFEAFIKQCRKVYDIILIDTPPLLSFADANIISKTADGVLLVAAAHQTKKTTLIEAKRSLEKIGATIIGIVLTKADFNKNANYYRYESDKRKR